MSFVSETINQSINKLSVDNFSTAALIVDTKGAFLWEDPDQDF